MWGMMKKMMGKKRGTKTWKKVFTGYKYHIETSGEVTPKTKLDMVTVKLIDIKTS